MHAVSLLVTGNSVTSVMLRAPSAAGDRGPRSLRHPLGQLMRFPLHCKKGGGEVETSTFLCHSRDGGNPVRLLLLLAPLGELTEVHDHL